ncbi:MAG: S8 family peptidase [Rhodobacteraceae bacterium]|nr:S8 family peptidase [Paracoccaceae bacterium]
MKNVKGQILTLLLAVILTAPICAQQTEINPSKPHIFWSKKKNVNLPGPEELRDVSYQAERWVVKKIGPDGQPLFTEIQTTKENMALLLESGEYLTAQYLIGAPKTESNTLSHNLSVNQINWLHAYKPTLTGELETLAIKERLFDTLDVDLYSRFLTSELKDNIIDSHATSMASIAAGAGNTSLLSKGAAFQAMLTSSSFLNTLPDNISFFNNSSAFIQNHSYGLEITNVYDLLAEAYDEQSHQNETLLHIFSAGNSGFVTPESGEYSNLGPFSNLTGGFKMAKNVLTVGAVDANMKVDIRSSKGPAADGRIKPELVAYGDGGTSDAAALASGTSILLSQAYQNWYQERIQSAQLKSVLIAGADTVGKSVVSYSSGFGNLNAKKSLEIIENNQVIEGSIINAQSFSQTISIPANTKSVRMALVWNDPAAQAEDSKALKNNLNLKVTHNGNEWLPWVLDPTPSSQMLNQIAERKVDTLNNIELVTFPVSTNSMTIEVSGQELTADQDFYISYWFEPINSFEWTYPTANDPQLSNSNGWTRFQNSHDNIGAVFLRMNGGDWQLLGETNQSNRMNLDWPSVEGIAQLKAVFGTDEFLSDEFLITQAITAEKLYLCGDEFLLSWNPINLTNVEYLLQIPGSDGFLTPLISTADTFAIIQRGQADFVYDKVSIVAEVAGHQSQPAQIYDFSTDGIGCFFKTFTASVNQETVQLNVELTGSFNIQSVSFEKIENEQFRALSTTNLPSSLNLSEEDFNTRSGYYQYRTKINLIDEIDGLTEVVTDTLELAVILENDIQLFPNPISNGDDLNILNDNLNAAYLHLLDSQGALLQVVQINLEADSFTIEGLSSGMYLYRIFSIDRELIKTGRLIVR